VKYRLGCIILLILLLHQIHPSGAEVAVPTELEIQIHRLVNTERDAVNLNKNPLKLHSKLIEIARAHSNDMLITPFFAHENPNTGEGPSDRVNKGGIVWTSVSENLYWAEGKSKNQLASSAVNGWTDSEGHYQNMLSDTTYTGIGIANQGSVYYVTQVFVEASLSHMQEMGVIYDNENLDEIGVESSSSPRITQTHIIIGMAILIIVVGWDAGRRNRRYRRSRRRY
jgi:hypothetical protein